MSSDPRVFDLMYRRILAAATRLLAEPLLGTPFLTLADERERWTRLPAAEREQWRSEALRAMLSYAVEHVPAYRTSGSELESFPVVDKHTIVADDTSYRSVDHEHFPTVSKHTGGTTGDPWNYPLDRRAWAEAYATQIYRFRQLGFGYGDRRLLLGFPASLGLQKMTWRKRLRLSVERANPYLSGFDVDPEASLGRAKQAAALEARMWYGYASTIAAMASAALDAGITLPGPNLIVTMAEPLWPAWRKDIEEAFGSKVVEEYGCNDGGIMAHRCSSGNLHLADHQSLVEILDDDGRPCPPGIDGSIVITNFHARHMPFIRYRAGDIGSFGPHPCPCGRPGRTLSRVSGRSGDFVRLPDGTELVPAAFFNPFNEVTGVRRWQIVQPDLESLIIRIEPRSNWNVDERTVILDWIRNETDNQLNLDLRVAEPFDLSGGGKHKVIVRQF